VVDRSGYWTGVRGAFLVGDTLYVGRRNGTLHHRLLDPDTGALGEARTVNLHDGRDGRRIPFPVPRLTGMFFVPSSHQLYYTVAGDERLFRRAFTPESRVVGALTDTVATGGLDLSRVTGMTLAGGRVIYGSRDGRLRSARFTRGRLVGTPRVLSRDGPWRVRGFAVPSW
jgi:hypothetical protein